MKITRPLFICAAAAAIGVLEGCEVGPNYKTPATTMPSAFLSAPPTTQPAVAVDVTQWWKSLNDPELDSLVTRAIAANPDLQIAVARLQQAREMEFIANGFALPELEASGAAARGSGTNSTKGRVAGPLNAGTKTTGLSEITEVGGIDAAWNLDLFGGLRREIEAAKYDTQAAAEARNDVPPLMSMTAACSFAWRSLPTTSAPNSNPTNWCRRGLTSASPTNSIPFWPSANWPKCRLSLPRFKPPFSRISGDWPCCWANSPRS
jgi:hypothetical protein